MQSIENICSFLDFLENAQDEYAKGWFYALLWAANASKCKLCLHFKENKKFMNGFLICNKCVIKEKRAIKKIENDFWEGKIK